jgi:HD-like signal output (HDOD) protein/prolyl-tRNA editing enzyme YbaK/EbsC (Cys-tRNA(Pro) deacylase)
VPLARKIEQYIISNAIQLQPVHHARSKDLAHALTLAGAVPEFAIKTILLIDRSGPAVLALPFLGTPDLDALNASTNRQFQVVDDQKAGKLFSDCDEGHLPFISQPYGLNVYVDDSVLSLEYGFVSSGCASTLLKLPSFSIRAAMQGATKGSFASITTTQEERSDFSFADQNDYSLDKVAEKLQSIHRLPPMPETAVRIMHLTSDPESNVSDLAGLVERDPSLSAQIMRYARSALFNYRGELICVKDAINVVLGFDRVSKLAMGIAAAKAFNIPSDGPLGLAKFWQHSLYTAVLAQALAMISNPELGIEDKDAYLSGLLHNFGMLLVGHIFPPEFRMLNKLREAEPDSSMRDIEMRVFGMGSAQSFISLGHGSMGAILLKIWGMPESTIKSAAMHQNHGYTGDQEEYVRLVQLANYLLGLHGVGDEPPAIDPTQLFASLGIDPEHAFQLAEVTVEQCRSLDDMANALVA